MTDATVTVARGNQWSWTARTVAWLRAGRGGLFLLALLVGVGAGLGAVAFRYLIYFFTWLATGHTEFGQQGYVGSSHLPWLGLGFFVVIPVIGGLLYGPLISRFAPEARGHGVPEVMIAVAEDGGRIRPQVSVVKALASALCIGVGGSVGREGPNVQNGSGGGAPRGEPRGRRGPLRSASGAGGRRSGSGSWLPAAPAARSRRRSTHRSPVCSSGSRSSCVSSRSTPCSR